MSRKSLTSLGFLILLLVASSLSLAAVTPKAKALILYDSGNPTSEEQLVLEYINRARANPVAEGQRLGIDIHEGLQDDASNGCYGPEYVGVRPPLAMNLILLTVAQAHSEDMYNQNYFSHTDPNGTTAFERMTNAGYSYDSAGENIGAGSGMSATDLEDTLMLDSGYPCRAHRMNLLDIFPYPPPAYYEVGIGYYQGPSGQAFITQDFGTAVDATPLLTGVVYNDANGNGFYDVGEGIQGVTITPSSGNYYAISSSSGGYAFPIPSSGTITVTASGNGFGPFTKTITLTGTNVELDFTSQGAITTSATQTNTQSNTRSTTQTSSQSTNQITTRSTLQTTYYSGTQTTYQSTTSTIETQTTSALVTQTSATSTVVPSLQSVTFQSAPSVFTDEIVPGTITACGGVYSNSQSAGACEMNFNATANLPTPSAGWQFNRWTWTGGVACMSDTANPVGCSAYNSGGVLIAVYAARVNFTISPSSSATINWGTCSSPGFGDGASFYSTNFGTTTVTACNIPSGYGFSGWSCSGGITCEPSLTQTNPTFVTLNGPGTLGLILQPKQTTTQTVSSITNSSSLVTSSVAYTSASIVPSSVSTSTHTAASVTSPLALTPIPGFPWEAIFGGILLGLFVLAFLRRCRMRFRELPSANTL